MGTLSLNCPLCCDEKFASHSSLKYHILSMIDNIMCPACNYRCDNILDLAEHLGRECREKEVEPLPDDSISQVTIKDEGSGSGDLSYSPDGNESKAVLINPKLEIQDPIENNGILEKALSETGDDNMLNENEDSSAGVLYMCQMCNVQFTSVEEHLQKYHAGEEVIYEGEDDSHLNDADNAEDMENGDGTDIEENMFDLNEDEEYNNSAEYIEDTKSSNTIEEQQCVDKDGRVYTRKVVKIDKFWIDRLEQEEDGPLTEQYLLENGKIRRISEEDAETVEDKDTIIQIHQCPKCFLQFPNLDHYHKHLCDPTKIKNKYKCAHCTAVFFTYQSLTGHMKSHLKKDEATGKIKRVVTLGPYTCDICNTMFPSFKSLRLHKKNARAY
ncbi:hypothetical protein NQ315_004490 [Exocentrus adspersus]|uniref:C2H2-type domain-containing protein n=1 Tax=Exocentrus adspersus TaxID=1586481 RepID=A0AAV8VPD7_9CUCU|nr:hypothetical protein NQ315_004490 [Exocentrus adspersus]